MNPISTTRYRRLTGLAIACWAIYSVVIAFVAMVSTQHQAVMPMRPAPMGRTVLIQTISPDAYALGVSPGDRLLAIDGVPVLNILRGRPVEFVEGRSNVYEIQKPGGEVRSVALLAVSEQFRRRAIDLALNSAMLLVSLVYLVIGAAVWRSKFERGESWAFMLFCSAMAVELSAWVHLDNTLFGATRLHYSNFPFLGATMFHLFTIYPLEPLWVVRHRRVRAVPYVLAGLITIAVAVDHAMITSFGPVIADTAFFFSIAMVVISMGVLISERPQARSSGVGDRTDIVIVAGLVSFIPAVLIVFAEYFLQASFPRYFAILWVVFLPVAIGVGMLRGQRFEFRILAKSSVAYGAATLAITGLFAFLITFADQAAERLGMNMRSAQIVFLFLAILTFNPLRDRLQRLVDRIFDRDRSRYRAAMSEISEAMVSMLSLREIGDRILVAATDTMGVERAMVLLFDEDDRVLRPSVWRGDWDDQDSHTEIPSEHPIWRHLWMRREELSRADFNEEPDVEKREICWDVFDALEVELLVPILFGVDLLGVIAVGRKMMGERLSVDDRQLLRTLANQSAIAMENAKAFDEIAKLNETLEARVEERTAELREIQGQLMQSEKLSAMGHLVAGVAHELNNPIGFVHANLQLLDEFIERLVVAQERGEDQEAIRETITKLLSRSREGTHRVKKIVQDLRTFSRMDQADLQDADLNEEIERTLTLTAPRLKDGIEVHRDFDQLPLIRCYPGQLNQVFLNLLMNACDALPGGGSIWIRTRREDGGVLIEFRDDGPGIEPKIQRRLFDPFFTTKEVGKGTGLGLSLSHGIIERHGGQITVVSEPGKGATFQIRLPLDASPVDA